MTWDADNDDLQARADVKRAQESQPLENGLESFFNNSNNGQPSVQPAQGFNGFGGGYLEQGQSQGQGLSQVQGLGQTINNGAVPTTQQPVQNNEPKRDLSDRAVDATYKVGKSMGEFLKLFKPYVLQLKELKRLHTFVVWMFYLNAGYFILTFLMVILLSNMFLPLMLASGFGLGLAVSSYGVGYIVFGSKWTVEESEEEEEVEEEPVQSSWSQPAPVPTTSCGDVSEVDDYGTDDEDWDDGYEDFDDDEEWEDDFDEEPELRTFDDIAVSVSSGVSEVKQAPDSAFESKVAGAEMGAGMVTRRGLLDKYLEVLDGSGTKADDVRHISPDSDEACKIENFLNNAVEGMGLTQDDWVSVNRIEERTVIFSIATTRPNKLKGKEGRFAEELTKVLKDKMSRELGESVYATAEGVGNEVLINIFKGIGARVFLRDVLLQKREFFESSKNLLPVTFGFNEFGEPIVGDLTKMVHTLFSGNPNSGKSNLASAVVNQLVALNSPKQVQFVVGDAKDGISDWKMFRVPHFKRFESTPEGIVNLLDWVVEVEEPRRTKLISDMGVIKIQDYNELSDTPLPYLFVVLDEVMTFSNIATPEQKAQYKRSLGVIVSKMRAVGIYLIAVPHRVVDDIFPASASALFGNRFAVKASEDVTKTVWKDAFRKIKFSISNVGDYAYTLDASNEPKFGHAPLLMENSARTAKLYEQQRKMWADLYPDEVITSQYFKDKTKAEQKEVLDRAGVSVSDDDFSKEEGFSSWVDDYISE